MPSYSYRNTDGRIGMQPIEEISTTQNHPLGTIVRATDPTYGEAEFIYLLGVASTVAGSWVTYDDNNTSYYATTLLLANARGAVAIAMAANVAGSYGWYMIRGVHPAAKCKTQFADNGHVFSTSTTGSVDDASVLGDLVLNAMGASATTANTFVAQFVINRPFAMDRNQL